jgi:hypothetical protein
LLNGLNKLGFTLAMKQKSWHSVCTSFCARHLATSAGLIASLTAKVVQAEDKSKIYFDFVEDSVSSFVRRKLNRASREKFNLSWNSNNMECL